MKFPDLHDVAVEAAQNLERADLALKEVVGEVDAGALLSSYARHRILKMHYEPEAFDSRPAPVAIELAASLLLPELGKNDHFDSRKIQKGIEALEKYQAAYALVEPLVRPDKMDEGEFDPLDVRLRLHAALVRGSAYPSLVIRRVENALFPFDSDLAELAGIGPLSAVQIAKAIMGQMDANLQSSLSTAQELEAQHAETVLSDPSCIKQQELALSEAIAELGLSWVPTFTEINERIGGLGRAEWEIFISLFGLSPDSLPKMTRVIDLQDRPMIFPDSDHVFGAHGHAVFDAIFNFYDSLARATPALRDSYGKSISSWMEVEIAGFFMRLFPEANVILSACYPDPDNPGGETEADIVVMWGPFLIVAEAKGKKVAQEAFRGGYGKLKSAVSKNVEDAFAQADRLIRALDTNGTLELKERATGRRLKVERDALRRIMPISVTLQHLLGIPTQLAVTQRLGLFKGNAYPWSVSIDDLDVITRFAGSPDVLLHYIERRLAHQQIEISLIGDELDMFGHYLDTRLHPEVYERREDVSDGNVGGRLVGFQGGEDRFEPFYIAEWYGNDAPPQNIGLDVSPEVGSILEHLRKREDDAARWIGFMLLGLSDRGLGNLVGAIQAVRSRDEGAGRVTQATFQEGAVLVLVLGHNAKSEDAFNEEMEERIQAEHYRAKASATVAFGINQRSPDIFESAKWRECEWKYDERMEVLSARTRRNQKDYPSA